MLQNAQNTATQRYGIPQTGELNRALGFLEHSTLAFSRAQDSHELDRLLDQILRPELFGYLSSHSDALLVLSMAWSANIRRIVFQGESVVFPNKLLLLPPLYQGLGWTDRANREWDAVHVETLERFTDSPSLNNAILLLFLDAMMLSLEEAVFLFGARMECMKASRNAVAQGLSLLDELYHYGWPELVEPSAFAQ